MLKNEFQKMNKVIERIFNQILCVSVFIRKLNFFNLWKECIKYDLKVYKKV